MKLPSNPITCALLFLLCTMLLLIRTQELFYICRRSLICTCIEGNINNKLSSYFFEAREL